MKLESQLPDPWSESSVAKLSHSGCLAYPASGLLSTRLSHRILRMPGHCRSELLGVLIHSCWVLALATEAACRCLAAVILGHARMPLHAWLLALLALAKHVESSRWLTMLTMQGGSNEENAALLEAVNASGKAFLVHTDLGGRYTLRMAIGSAQTQARHVDAAWALICNLAEQLPCRSG